jgi:hypothetical protein
MPNMCALYRYKETIIQPVDILFRFINGWKLNLLEFIVPVNDPGLGSTTTLLYLFISTFNHEPSSDRKETTLR